MDMCEMTVAMPRRRPGGPELIDGAKPSPPVGGVANAPVTAAVQPMIKRERQGQGDRSGPHAGLCTAHV
jgi:hypothetical protein